MMSPLIHRRAPWAAVLGMALASPMTLAAPPQRGPMVLAPVVEGVLLCEEALRDRRVRALLDAKSPCEATRFDAALALERTLDALEPGGPAGKVQVGYTLPIPLLALHRRASKGEWALDTERVDRILAVVARVRRPVVLYLLADHFDTQGGITDALVKNPANLMLLADGKAPVTDYFGNRIVPYTLLTDDDLPVNRYRYTALRQVSERIARMPVDARERIVAVTLAGELHHLFKDFESGMGAHEAMHTTDYSPRSVAGFHRWLAARYGDIAAFNRAHGFSYADFAAVPAPSRDIRTQRLGSFGEHYDGFAAGTLPVSGWLWDAQRKVATLDLYLDGKLVGPIDRGLNRLDVYRALEPLADPNVGFRRDLAFDTLAPGRHRVQVVATADGARRLLAQFEFRIVPRDQSRVPDVVPPGLDNLPALQAVPGVKTWLDLPRDGQDVYFNPLARDWNAYRASQPAALLERFFTIARDAGVPAAKLYSHQIVPQVNSTWNPQLFAVDATHRADAPWKAGINLYGGATDSPWVRQWIASHRLTDYGVPEFNPQQWKRPGVALAALRAQYDQGARFVSPYYMSIKSSPTIKKMLALKAMELRPDNPADGADQLYGAMREMAAQ